MSKLKKEVGVKDVSGNVYLFFLYFMVGSHIGFLINNVFHGEIMITMFHILGMVYFMLRIHVFLKIKDEANNSGHSLIEYLRKRYGS